MPSAFFLAQSAAEFHKALPFPAQKAWMACHFSSYGPGLSNLPDALPAGSMVMVNDRTPAFQHDPGLIIKQLQEIIENWQCSCVLLDFERSGQEENAIIAKAIVQALSCPVGVSANYAGGLDCAVFLPPLPLCKPVIEYIAPWKGRPIWLEVMPDCTAFTVSENGCVQNRCEETGEYPHYDRNLFSSYRTEILTNAIRFTLRRGPQELEHLRNVAQIDRLVGLYQEFIQPEAQATAFSQ